MPERATSFQTVQVGVEATPGVSVAANKLLQSISIDPAIKSKVNTFSPTGNKFITLASLGEEWTESKITGDLTYTEIVYLLSSLINTGVITAGGTASKVWTFTPASSAPDNPKTLTVEHGSSVRADKFVYGLITGLTLKGTREKIDLSGTMLGQAISDAITMTAAPSPIALVPVLPGQVTAYMDDTGATLGTTAITRLLSWEWALTDRFAPLWAINATNASFVAHVEKDPKATVKLMVEADAQGMGLLTNLRSGATKFIRVQAVGAVIAGETTHKYTFTLDTAGKVTDVSEYKDDQGVYAIEWTLTAAHDATWGQALQASAENLLTTL